MDAILIDPKMGRLLEAGLFGMWFVDAENINLEDLCSSRPGGVVRCKGNPNDVVKFIPSDEHGVEGCIAGWISEDEPEAV